MVKVFVNGTFDVLHTGHLSLLNAAKAMGDHLQVACDSDRRVSELKGPQRPVCDQTVRSTLLANLQAVDAVKIFDSDQELEQIIAEYQPHIMVVGSDWQHRPVIGSQHAQQLVFYPRVNHESTTKTIENFLRKAK